MFTRQSENYNDVLRGLGYKPMTGPGFEKLKGEHTFSGSYQKQKDYVLSELNSPVRRYNRYGWQLAVRILMVVFVVCICIPGGIYAMDKVHQVMLTGENKKERLTFSDRTRKVDVEDGMWEYIKVDCTYLPKDVLMDDRYLGYGGKNKKDEEWKEYGSFAAYRWDHNMAFDSESVFGENVVKGATGGYSYVMISKAEGWKEVYVKYIPADVVICASLNGIYGVDEIMAVIAGLRFEKAADDSEKQALKVVLPEDETYLWGEKKNAEQMKKSDYVSVGDTFYEDGLAVTVNRIDIADTLSSYQDSCFKEQTGEGVLDETGRLLPDYRFVYVSLTVKNEGKAKITDYYVNRMHYWVLKKRGDGYERAAVSQCPNSPVYFDASIEGADKKGFFRLGDIPVGEEITYHIGYYVPADPEGELWLAVPKSQGISDEFTFVRMK